MRDSDIKEVTGIITFCWSSLLTTTILIRVLEWHRLRLYMVGGVWHLCVMMFTSQSRQKSYHDKRRKALEFQKGDHMFLRVTLVTGVGRALNFKKLTSRFIGPYQIFKRLWEVAYRVTLPPSLSNLHSVFHLSQLWKYVSDPSHVIQLDDVQVKRTWLLRHDPCILRITKWNTWEVKRSSWWRWCGMNLSEGAWHRS